MIQEYQKEYIKASCIAKPWGQTEIGYNLTQVGEVDM